MFLLSSHLCCTNCNDKLPAIITWQSSYGRQGESLLEGTVSLTLFSITRHYRAVTQYSCLEFSLKGCFEFILLKRIHRRDVTSNHRCESMCLSLPPIYMQFPLTLSRTLANQQHGGGCPWVEGGLSSPLLTCGQTVTTQILVVEYFLSI